MSIRENELRVGVYILYCEKVFKVDAECISMHWGDDLDDAYRPIPLTKEWLLNLGFKKDVDGSFMKNDISIFLDKRFKTNLFLQENQDNFKWFSYECKIQYVHQLQNLYSALTGDELTIKE
jgi:hypothetical protein